MPQFGRLDFYLADAFAGYLEAMSYFFRCMFGVVFESEAHLERALFRRSQGSQHLRGLPRLNRLALTAVVTNRPSGRARPALRSSALRMSAS